MKITYKKHKEKGLAAIGSGIYVECKIKKKVFAIISGLSVFNPKLKIQVAVKVNNKWEWKFLKHECENEDDAKDFLEKKLPFIMEQFELHFFEN